jgi:hypothetical protein
MRRSVSYTHGIKHTMHGHINAGNSIVLNLS